MYTAIETALVEILIISLSFSIILITALAYNRYILKKKIAYLMEYIREQTRQTIAAQADIAKLKDMQADNL